MRIKGVFINCPYKICKKMLLKDAYLRNGVDFKMRCYFCGEAVQIEVEAGEIKLRMLNPPVDKSVDNSTFDEEEENDIIFLS